AAIRCDDPVVYMEHKNLWPLEGAVDEAATEPALGEAAVRREGADLTIVSWSATVHEALAAAQLLADEGTDAEVIDLRTLWPWDRERVFQSVEKTGRLLVTHEAVAVAGFGAEVAASVAEHVRLKAPIARLGAPRAPIAYAPTMENVLRITAEKIAQRARTLMKS
ncbi:MAG: transketolase C-terminal domain-containing protein, partial [Pseudomonadota bacterium]